MLMVPNQLRMVMLITQSLVKLTEDPEDYPSKKMVTNCMRAIVQEHRLVYDSTHNSLAPDEYGLFYFD